MFYQRAFMDTISHVSILNMGTPWGMLGLHKHVLSYGALRSCKWVPWMGLRGSSSAVRPVNESPGGATLLRPAPGWQPCCSIAVSPCAVCRSNQTHFSRVRPGHYREGNIASGEVWMDCIHFYTPRRAHSLYSTVSICWPISMYRGSMWSLAIVVRRLHCLLSTPLANEYYGEKPI